MTGLERKFEDCEIVVRAGPGGESDDNIFRYTSSPLPPWFNSNAEAQDYYDQIRLAALSLATEIVRETRRCVTLTYSVKVELDQ